MVDRLILVDFENIQQIDLSILDDSYRAIVYVGYTQEPPRAARAPATAHRFRRVQFIKVLGSGRNSLDFYIACQLGRTLETAPSTECFVLSGDKGYDALLMHLNELGLVCRRVESLEVLRPLEARVACPRCGKAKTIEHHGGRWCSNCGRFAVPPDPALLPSRQPGYVERNTTLDRLDSARSNLTCTRCYRRMDPGDGIYDDGEWMCRDCIVDYTD